jgi:transcriptional regulator with XRE-family HTH domain
MFAFHDLAIAVRTRRQDIGLTQHDLAKLAGCSLSLVEAVEVGTADDLGLKQAAALLAPLGLSLFVTNPHPKLHPSPQASDGSIRDVAARTASTSYRTLMPAEAINDALRTGIPPDGFEPHMRVLLDESPLALLAKVVEQAHLDSDVPRAVLWAHLRSMAIALQSYRDIWNVDR